MQRRSQGRRFRLRPPFATLVSKLTTVGTSVVDEYREPSIPELRLKRMKHLRVDDVIFADMVPVLIAEGLIPEHGDHGAQRSSAGRRTEERNRVVCSHCEHLINEQWKRNVNKLTADDARMFDARFVWVNQALKRAIKCEAMVIQAAAEVVTEKVQRIKGENGEESEVVVERVTRRETKIFPEFMRMAIDLRRDIARLSGVPVGDVGKEIDPDRAKRSGRKVMRVGERTDPVDTERAN